MSELDPAPSHAPLDVWIQPHGSVLVLDRPGCTLIRASETAARQLGVDLPAAFGAPIDRLLNGALAQRVRALAASAEERRMVTLPGGPFDARFLVRPEQITIELEPFDPEGDAASLGASLDDAALALSDAASLADIGRAACARLAETAGFGLVALARLLPGGQAEIVGEHRDETLPSLFGRTEDLALLLRLAPPSGIFFVADATAPPARLLSAPGRTECTGSLPRLELAAPPPDLLARARAEGVVALAVIPAVAEGRVWGYFVAEHAGRRQLGHHRRRFTLELGRLTAAAAERVLRNAKRRARRLAPDILTAFREAVERGTPPLDALLFGDQLLAGVVRADGVAVICGDECAVVGRAPDPDALMARLPALLAGTTTTLATNRLVELGGFAPAEVAGTTRALVIRIAAEPFIALAAFRQDSEAENGAGAALWDPHRVEAFNALAAAFRRTLLLGDAAAAAELSSQLAEFEVGAFSQGRLRSAIMGVSATGMALVLGQAADLLMVVECNQTFRRLLGLDQRELPSGTAQALAQRLGLPEAALSDGGRAALELEIWSAELGPRIVEVDTRAIVRTRVGGIARQLTLIQLTDLTRIRRQELAMRMARDQALALIRSRDEVLANMSHELRTPLNAVIGFAEMIAEQTLGSVGDARYAGYGRDIENAGRHLLSLINDVLDLSRLQSGRQLMHEDTLDLTALVRSCLEWARAASKNRNLELALDGDTEALWLRGDERALRQVLINLISNAVKFTPEDGKVTVRLRWRNGQPAVVEVTDNGIGMSSQELARVFEPFFRGGGAYRRRIEGAGLGLSIARGLVELHGGSLTLGSVEGQGTTARLELPPWRVVAQDGETTGGEEAPAP